MSQTFASIQRRRLLFSRRARLTSELSLAVMWLQVRQQPHSDPLRRWSIPHCLSRPPIRILVPHETDLTLTRWFRRLSHCSKLRTWCPFILQHREQMAHDHRPFAKTTLKTTHRTTHRTKESTGKGHTTITTVPKNSGATSVSIACSSTM